MNINMCSICVYSTPKSLSSQTISHPPEKWEWLDRPSLVRVLLDRLPHVPSNSQSCMYLSPSIDSVHNDGERHIPYITIFPNSTINKLYAWAKFQLPNGMIQEQLRCGCEDIPLEPQVSLSV